MRKCRQSCFAWEGKKNNKVLESRQGWKEYFKAKLAFVFSLLIEEGSVCTAIVRLRCIDRPRRSLILRGTFKGGDWITFPVHTLGKTVVCVYRCRSAARTRPHKTHNPLYWHIRSQRTCQTFLQIHKNLLRGFQESAWMYDCYLQFANLPQKQSCCSSTKAVFVYPTPCDRGPLFYLHRNLLPSQNHPSCAHRETRKQI